MAEMMTVKQASERWNIFDSRITKLCREGKIPGAVKDGKSWLIPVDTPKPADNRYKKQPNKLKQEKLPLPVGVSEYRVASTQYYYIDKTMMIKDFLDERPMVSLFTRPRRFGKTLNMDMLKTFFEKSDEDTSVVNYVGTGVLDRPLTQQNLRMVREAHPYAHRVRLCEINEPDKLEFI